MKLAKNRVINYLSEATAIAIAFGLGMLIIVLFTGKNPFTAYGVFLGQSFFSKYGILEVLSKAIPISIAATGMTIAFRCGIINMGAEGQMAIAAIISTALGLFVNIPGVLLVPLIFLCSFIGGALWAGIAGYLKVKLGVNEMLCTLMLNYIALKLMEYMISGPMTQPNQTYPRTSEILPQAQMPFISYPLSYTIIIAILIIPLSWYLINRTSLGYKLQAVGLDLEAARLAGMNIPALTMIIMIISGGICAFAGTVEIVGDFFCMERNVTGGYGFTAIIVIMLSKETIRAIPISTLFIAGMIVGATALPLVEIPSTFSQILIGILLLCTVASDYIAKIIERMWK